MIDDIDARTICACATGPVAGAISVIRISGKEAVPIVGAVFHPRNAHSDFLSSSGYTLHFGEIHTDSGKLLDEVIVSVFRAPNSYTGEDSVEISCHGSSFIVQEIMSLLLSHGAANATAGEFTKRAFLNGKMDLAQAEAVADLIAIETEASHRLAMQQMKGGFSCELAAMRSELLHIVTLMELELDFSEEEVEFADRKELSSLLLSTANHINTLVKSFKLGNAIKNGVPVAIIGATNTGKSTLLNALVGEERAIVSSIAGTTRDTIEDIINLDGIKFRFIDTAGIRTTTETIEQIGIERTYSKLRQASIILLMLDATRPEEFTSTLSDISSKIIPEQTLVVLVNKCDNLEEFATSGIDLDRIFEYVDLVDSANFEQKQCGECSVQGEDNVCVSDLVSSNFEDLDACAREDATGSCGDGNTSWNMRDGLNTPTLRAGGSCGDGDTLISSRDGLNTSLRFKGSGGDGDTLENPRFELNGIDEVDTLQGCGGNADYSSENDAAEAIVCDKLCELPASGTRHNLGYTSKVVENQGVQGAQNIQDVQNYQGVQVAISRRIPILEEAVKAAKKLHLSPAAIIPLSAKQKQGISALQSILFKTQQHPMTTSNATLVSNLRHLNALKEAHSALTRAHASLSQNIPADLISQDIREALHSLGTILGEISTDEVLGEIFAKFCIGK